MFSTRELIYIITVIFSLLFSLTSHANPKDEKAIKVLIEEYGKAINESNVDAIVSLFTIDAVFMPAGEHTSIGVTQIRSAFEHEFKNIDLDVKIVFDEILQQGNMAVVRSRSDGNLTFLANKKRVATDAYRAFFVLLKQQSEWKIARFMFNFTKK